MNRIPRFLILILVLSIFGLAACSTPAVPQDPPTAVPTEVAEPTATIAPTETPVPPPTATPEPTPIPGEVVIPIEEMSNGVPWLPFNADHDPTVSFLGFNATRPPFDNPLVRQAFALAVDRQALVEMYKEYDDIERFAATVLTPPQILGRDLNGVVGLSFNPLLAQQKLVEAGYDQPYKLGEINILLSAGSSFGEYPGLGQKRVQMLVDMWKKHLGVTVTIKNVQSTGKYVRENDDYNIYFIGWLADMTDPDNFFRPMFHTDGEINYGHYSNPRLDALIEQAANATGDNALRQEMYIRAEKMLCEEDAGLIPLYYFFSKYG